MGKTKAPDLSTEEAGVLSVVRAQPAPRTRTELVRIYETQHGNALAPELSEAEIQSTLGSLEKKGLLEAGPTAPDGEAVIQLKGEGTPKDKHYKPGELDGVEDEAESAPADETPDDEAGE